MQGSLDDLAVGLRLLPTYLQRIECFHRHKNAYWSASWSEIDSARLLEPLLGLITDESWEELTAEAKVGHASSLCLPLFLANDQITKTRKIAPMMRIVLEKILVCISSILAQSHSQRVLKSKVAAIASRFLEIARLESTGRRIYVAKSRVILLLRCIGPSSEKDESL